MKVLRTPKRVFGDSVIHAIMEDLPARRLLAVISFTNLADNIAMSYSADGIQYQLNGGPVTDVPLTSHETVTIQAMGGNDTLTFTNDAVGTHTRTFDMGDGNDTITFDSVQTSPVDVILGGAGNDHIIEPSGFYGSENIDGGSGTDLIDYSGRGSANPHHINLDGSFGSSGVSGEQDFLTNIEQCFGSAADDTISGNGVPTSVTITGGSGNDTLKGHNSTDSIEGDAGNDVLQYTPGGGTGSSGHETLLGGSGVDTIDYSLMTSGTHTDASLGGVANIYVSGVLTYKQDVTAEAFIGGPDADTLTGDANNNTLYGGTGSDSINGGSGDDVIHGDAGDDTIQGTSGNDTLYGDDGNDSIVGGSGNDSMRGGNNNDYFDSRDGVFGNDTMFGESGADTADIDDNGTTRDSFTQ